MKSRQLKKYESYIKYEMHIPYTPSNIVYDINTHHWYERKGAVRKPYHDPIEVLIEDELATQFDIPKGQYNFSQIRHNKKEFSKRGDKKRYDHKWMNSHKISIEAARAQKLDCILFSLIKVAFEELDEEVQEKYNPLDITNKLLS